MQLCVSCDIIYMRDVCFVFLVITEKGGARIGATFFNFCPLKNRCSP